MSQARTGRLIAGVGVICGFAAIWTDSVSAGRASTRYSDDGTVLAFLLVFLVSTAILLVASSETAAAVLGSIVCGFYLLVPAGYGFNHLGLLAAGAWLGVCTISIPLGMALVLAARPRRAQPPAPAQVLSAVGRILCLIAIWLSAGGGVSYWNLADEGRALPSLMLLLVLLGAQRAAAGEATARRGNGGVLILASMTFGIYAASAIFAAFDQLGSLEAGAWLGAGGAALLLVVVVGVWRRAVTLAA